VHLATDVLEAAAAVAETLALALAVAEVVELGAARVAVADHLDARDQRRVQRGDALDSDAIDDLANHDHLVDPAARARDQHALKVLLTLLITFDNPERDHQRVADVHPGQTGLERGGVDGFENLLLRHIKIQGEPA